MTPPTIEQSLANLTLRATAKSVSTALSEYQKWLVAGIGAAIGLLLPKLHELAQLIGEGRAAVVVVLLCVTILMAVVSLLLGAQVLASTSVASEMQDAVKALAENAQDDRDPDVEALFSEARRGMWWPASWGFDYGRRALERGDHVASARLVAKLSQSQMYLVAGQILMILVTLIVAATAAI